MSSVVTLDQELEEQERKARPMTPPIAPPSGRLGLSIKNEILAAIGLPWQRRLARAALLVPAIRHWEQEFGRFSDEDLRRHANSLRGRARGGEKLKKLVPEAFGLCSVAIWRTLGYQPYDVQLAAGVCLHEGACVELATGEGKTLTASLPAFLNALVGKGVHVTTVNDYLAKRDAEYTGPIYEMLGLSIGVLQMKMEDAHRKEMYRKDITYGTASEFGFDFLRDRLKLRGGQATTAPFWSAWMDGQGGGQKDLDPRVQRPLYYAIVDEGDSIFIDEAKTPLIISSPTRQATPEEQVVYHWANRVAQSMVQGEHYLMNVKKDKIELTEMGRHHIRYSNPPTGEHSEALDKLTEQVEKSIQANHRFIRDHHYMVHEDKVVIIDESTGRPMPDRHWREGLHQAVEAKEKVPITLASAHAAQITFQNFYKLYKKLAGMTGTIVQNWREMRRVYRLWVVQVPTNKPVVRDLYPERVFPTEEAKFDAIVEQVRQMQQKGRPVLIGTRSVEKSERISEKLSNLGVPHQVLNARQNEQEAEVVAQAGQPGQVTVATNMAGRGTDIKLGDGVAQLGGLHVIATEYHEAKRIDRQLIGRAGRQGDPGSGQIFLSLEDGVLEALGVRKKDALEAVGERGGNRDWRMFLKFFRKAQRRTERKHYRQRLDLMFFDRNRQELLADLGADPFVD